MAGTPFEFYKSFVVHIVYGIIPRVSLSYFLKVGIYVKYVELLEREASQHCAPCREKHVPVHRRRH